MCLAPMASWPMVTVDVGTGFSRTGQVTWPMLEGLRGHAAAVAMEPGYQPAQDAVGLMADAQQDGMVTG